MPIAKSLFRRTPIREVVPEVLARNGSQPLADAVEKEGLPGRIRRWTGERRAAQEREELSDALAQAPEEEPVTASGEAAPEERASVDAAELEAARAAAAAAEAARAEARAEAARAEALLAEALREAEAREAEARAAAAELQAARAEAAQLERALLEAARAGAARAEAERQQAEHVERTLAVAEDARADAPRVATAHAQATRIDTEAGTEERDRQAAQPTPAETELTCEISFWRGYRKSAFFARTHVDGETVAVAESPLFRARRNGLPEKSGEALAAYEALCEKLERQGWEPSGSLGTWFGQVFRRELTVPAEPAPE